MNKTMTSKFSSYCPSCSSKINAGDTIVADGTKKNRSGKEKTRWVCVKCKPVEGGDDTPAPTPEGDSPATPDFEETPWSVEQRHQYERETTGDRTYHSCNAQNQRKMIADICKGGTISATVLRQLDSGGRNAVHRAWKETVESTGPVSAKIAGIKKASEILGWAMPEVETPKPEPKKEEQPMPTPDNDNTPTPDDGLTEEERKALEILRGGRLKPEEVKAIVDEAVKKAKEEVSVSEEDIDKAVKKRLDKHVKKVELKLPNGDVKVIERAHEMFEEILNLVQMRMHVMLVGPAGSGKTTVCHNVADALDIDFYCQSVGQQTTALQLLGYMDASGNYVESMLYKAYKNGGMFVMDEIDAGNANVITVKNALLSNGSYRFPNGELVEIHPDFCFMACANTFGRGADRLYVGRNQLDAATLDRFVVLDFDYDEGFERELALAHAAEGKEEEVGTWVDTVHKLRKAAFDLKERVVISPRASINGAKLISGGFKTERLLQIVVFKGVSRDMQTRIAEKAGVKLAA